MRKALFMSGLILGCMSPAFSAPPPGHEPAYYGPPESIPPPARDRAFDRLVAELTELLHTDFEREGISTVGGLVYEQFGRAPKQGESFQLGGYRVTVDRVERRRVQRVSFERQDSRSGHAA